MNILGYLIVSIFIIGISYGLVLQIQRLLTNKKTARTTEYRRLMLANYLTCFSIAGFLVAFILNVLVYMQFIQSQFITSNSTSISCFIFLFVLFISKFLISPKNYNKSKLSILK